MDSYLRTVEKLEKVDIFNDYVVIDSLQTYSVDFQTEEKTFFPFLHPKNPESKLMNLKIFEEYLVNLAKKITKSRTLLQVKSEGRIMLNQLLQDFETNLGELRYSRLDQHKTITFQFLDLDKKPISHQEELKKTLKDVAYSQTEEKIIYLIDIECLA